MRLTRFLFILLAGLPSPWLSPARAAELLRNPDFTASADGRLADGWHDGSTALPQPAAFAMAADAESGRRLQQMTLGPLEGGRFRLVQTIPSLAGGTYRLQLRCRASSPVQVELALRTTAAPWTVFGSMRESLPAGTWSAVTGYARVPAGRAPGDFVVLVNDPGIVALASAGLEPVNEADLPPEERLRVEQVLGPPLPPVDEAQVIAGINSRILAHRTVPITVNVVDASGRPVPGATVRVEHVGHGFWFGAGFDRRLLHEDNSEADRLHREAFLRLFNAATIQLYAASYEPRPGAYSDDEYLQALDWIDRHGLRASGDSLYWNLAAPRWLGTPDASANVLQQWMDRLLEHASQTIFPSMASVDVFNEVVAWERFRTPLTPVLPGGRKAAVIAGYTRRFKALNSRTAAMVNDYDTTPEYYHLLKERPGGGRRARCDRPAEPHAQRRVAGRAIVECPEPARPAGPAGVFHGVERRLRRAARLQFPARRSAVGNDTGRRGGAGRLPGAFLPAGLQPSGGCRRHVLGLLGPGGLAGMPGRSAAQGWHTEAGLRAAGPVDQPGVAHAGDVSCRRSRAAGRAACVRRRIPDFR